ncbi:MAG: hypothetical protein ACJAVT_000552 [Yoonia sp.]|jgi:hypothetical protein
MNNEVNPDVNEVDQSEKDRRGNLYAVEICFLAFIGVIVVVAFLEATTYKIVSSRTPFVIMVPLLILIAIHATRLWRIRSEFHPGRRIRGALHGGNICLNKIVGFSGWMIGMLIIIAVLGHYAGIFLFCVILMRFLEAESWVLTLAVAAGTVLFIYGVFEIAFNIDLYRGLIPRWFMGFRDF